MVAGVVEHWQLAGTDKLVQALRLSREVNKAGARRDMRQDLDEHPMVLDELQML